MGYNESTGQYDEYPRSNFPKAVDSWTNKQDVPVSMQPILAQYQTAWDDIDIDKITELKEKYPKLDTYLFTAVDINQVYDGIKATQQFFKDDVETYLEKISQYEIGVNDNPTTEEKTTSSYSCDKVDNLTGITAATNITISTGSWSAVSRDDGFNYQYIYTNDKILATDHVIVYFNISSVIPASKATVNVGNTTTDGQIVFLSAKVPKKDLVIDEITYCRK